MNKMIVMLSVLGMCAGDICPSVNSAYKFVGAKNYDDTLPQTSNFHHHNYQGLYLNSYFNQNLQTTLKKIDQILCDEEYKEYVHILCLSDNMLTDQCMYVLLTWLSANSRGKYFTKIDLSNNRISFEDKALLKCFLDFIKSSNGAKLFWDFRINNLAKDVEQALLKQNQEQTVMQVQIW